MSRIPHRRSKKVINLKIYSHLYHCHIYCDLRVYCRVLHAAIHACRCAALRLRPRGRHHLSFARQRSAIAIGCPLPPLHDIRGISSPLKRNTWRSSSKGGGSEVIFKVLPPVRLAVNPDDGSGFYLDCGCPCSMPCRPPSGMCAPACVSKRSGKVGIVLLGQRQGRS